MVRETESGFAEIVLDQFGDFLQRALRVLACRNDFEFASRFRPQHHDIEDVLAVDLCSVLTDVDFAGKAIA